MRQKSSLDEGPKGQRRHIAVGKEKTVHAMFGRRFGEEFRDVEVTPSPTIDEMPRREPPRFTLRDEVHVFHEHQPTLWTPKHTKWKGDAPDREGMMLIQGTTAITGRRNKTGWKTPKETPKTRVKRRRAQRWAEKWG